MKKKTIVAYQDACKANTGDGANAETQAAQDTAQSNLNAEALAIDASTLPEDAE